MYVSGSGPAGTDHGVAAGCAGAVGAAAVVRWGAVCGVEHDA